MIDDKTSALVAAVLSIPVGYRILEAVQDERRVGQGINQLVDTYFMLRKMLKKGFESGR
jgi:hypothetical protein